MKKKNKRNSEQGFTFAEVMIVIAIFGILAAIAIPNFLRSQPERRLRNATRNLYSDFQKARLVSVRNNMNVIVSFNTVAGTYTYTNTGFDEATGQKITYPTDGRLAEYGAVRFGCKATTTDWDGNALSDTTMTTFTDDQVRFTPDGLAQEKNGEGIFVMVPSVGNAVEEAVFLQSDNDKTVCFAVTVTSFGSVKIRAYSDGVWR